MMHRLTKGFVDLIYTLCRLFTLNVRLLRNWMLTAVVLFHGN